MTDPHPGSNVTKSRKHATTKRMNEFSFRQVEDELVRVKAKLLRVEGDVIAQERQNEHISKRIERLERRIYG